jgi:hypothetical protein
MVDAKSVTVTDLNLDMQSLYLLAAPSTPPKVREEILDRAKSEKVAHAEVKRAVAEAQPTSTRTPKRTGSATSKRTSPASAPAPKPTTCHDLRDCWDRAPPDERQRFVDAVSLRALFEAASPDYQEAFLKEAHATSAQPDDDISLLSPAELVAPVVKAANGGMPEIPSFLRRTKQPAPAEDIDEAEEAAR